MQHCHEKQGHAMHQPWDGYCFEQRKQRPVSNDSPPAAVALCPSVPVPWNVSPPMATTGTQATSACEAPSAQLNLGFAWGLFRNTASDKDRGYKAIMVGSDIRVEFSTYIHLDG